MKNGYVYLKKSDIYYKIGKTINPEGRLTPYVTENPVEIEIVCMEYVKNYASVELHLHKMFHGKRHRGEWFILSQSDVDRAIEYLERRVVQNREPKHSNRVYSIRISDDVYKELEAKKNESGKTWSRFFKDIMYGHDTS